MRAGKSPADKIGRRRGSGRLRSGMVGLGLLGFLPNAGSKPPPSNAQSETPAGPRPPYDIVLIVTDDQPYHSLDFLPQISALIRDIGVALESAFDSFPLCCPSRASIFTGLYAHHHGVTSNAPPNGGALQFHDSSTIATWLHAAGYRTGLFGKYLNNYDLLQPFPYIPPGWDEWHALLTSAGYFDYDLVENGALVHYGHGAATYSTTLLARQAVHFIETTPSNEHLFLYFAPFAPHDPVIPHPDDLNSLDDLPPYHPPHYNEADVTDKPAWVRALPLLGVEADSLLTVRYRRTAETLKAVDRSVAHIVKALEQTGRLSSTVIVFLTDNGFALGEHRWVGKNCIYEECVHSPLLIRAPRTRPRKDDHLVLNIDLAPTIAEWAGVVPPDPLDGMSLVPLLADPSTQWRDAILLEVLGGVRDYRQKCKAIRTARYLYAEYLNGDRELYDLALDPYELTNAVNDSLNAPLIKDLRKKLIKLNKSLPSQLKLRSIPSGS